MSNTKTNKGTVIQKYGNVILGITASLGIGLSIICASFIAPAFRKCCLPYVPATPQQINNILKLIPINRYGKLLDIGSGDGRIVLATASKKNLESHGIEINFWLYIYSKLMAIKCGQFSKARFHYGDLWKFDLSPYDHFVIFGVEQMMRDIEIKLLKDVKISAKVIVCRFPLPSLSPVQIIGHGIDTVWLYEINNV